MNEIRQRLVGQAGRAIARGSKSFRFASHIFDRETRERSWLLYAWCRACDDITDGQILGHGASVPDDPDGRLAFIRDATDRALSGEATGLVPFDALGLVAAECAIPHELPRDHLAGFARDAAGWRPANEAELLSYCYQVAGAVGVMMGHVMGVEANDRDTRSNDTFWRASDLGIAFQLANIARDIVEDARVGRCYLPADWLAKEGLAGTDLTDPAHRDALATIAARLATLARRYRDSSRVGAARLPFRSRWAVLSAARIYGWIVDRAATLGPRAWDRRIATAKPVKCALLLAAFGDALRSPPSFSRAGLWTRPRASAASPPPARRSRPARPSAARPAGRRRNRS